MKLSNTGMGTTKLNNIDEMYPGQSILLQTGQLVQYGAGLFGYNTIPLLVKRNIEKIIVDTLNKYDCIECLLPILQPDTIWKNSGRYEHYISDGTMLITESNKGTFCLAPTAEEAVVEFAREKLKSYKNLPATYYQIGEKFRNEIRTRGYLLRGKAFTMLDAYSFDVDEKAMAKSYENVRTAFLEIFEKIGLKGSFLKFTLPSGKKVILEKDIPEHTVGIEFILETLSGAKYGCIKSLDEIEAVGHRVVHGGEKFNQSVLIDKEVKAKIIECIDIAPLHNPANLKGIDAVEKILPKVPQVAVFDTAFHQTMPKHAYMYALPYEMYEKYGIRRYGFHGTSHRYVSRRARKW